VSKKRSENPLVPVAEAVPGYDHVLKGVIHVLEQARRASARAVNFFITATYWEIGRQIVEFEQAGQARSIYGERLLKRLAADLTLRFGRGFSLTNLKQVRKFYLIYRMIKKGQTLSDLFPHPEACPKGQTAPDLSLSTILQTASEELADATILQTPSAKSAASSQQLIRQTLSDESTIPLADLARRFPLPWSHYVLLLKVEKPEARDFYETEAQRHGWTVRQPERQITTLFYERTLASRNKGAMLKKGAVAGKPDAASKPPRHRLAKSGVAS
jgi:DUF1016 N-terminal domain